MSESLSHSEERTPSLEKGEGYEYPENFSQLIEQASGEFIIDHFSHVKEVDFATPQDDAGIPWDQKGFDMVLVWDNGMRMAVDVTYTDDPKSLRRKMGVRLPLVSQHKRGEDGREEIVAKNIPQATVTFGLEAANDWAQARARWMEGGRKGRISDWLQAPGAMTMEILAGLYRSFEEAADRHPAMASPFKTAMETLRAQVKEMVAEEASAFASRRDIRDIAHRIKNPLKNTERNI